MVDFLKQNIDVFAWDALEMKGVDPEVITHKLHVDPTHKPIKQKSRRMAPHHAQAVNEEVEKLLNASTIREV